MRGKGLKAFVGMGAISLAVILIVLTITCFAVLTYVSADSEYKLSEKSKMAVDQYYRADTKANENLAEISDAVKNKKLQDIAAKKGYNVTNSGRLSIVSFQVPVNRTQKLRVEAAFTDLGRAEIRRWETENLMQEENQ